MKKILAVLLLAAVLVFAGCTDSGYTLSQADGVSTRLTVSDTTPDFTSYFKITDKDGNNVAVTSDMLDLSNVNMSTPGVFTVTLAYKGQKLSVTFMVLDADTTGGNTPGGDNTPGGGDDTQKEPDIDLSAILGKYSDYAGWNFLVTYSLIGGGYDGASDYGYKNGNELFYSYTDDDGARYKDYIVFGDTENFYYAEEDGRYVRYSSNGSNFDNYYQYVDEFDLSVLSGITFTYLKTENGVYVYSASDANGAGNDVLGVMTGEVYKSFLIGIKNGELVYIRTTSECDGDQYTTSLDFSGHGTVDFDVDSLGATDGDSSSGGGENPDPNPDPTPDPTPSGKMDQQVYDSSKHDDSRLQDKLLTNDGAIGLPSKGTYNALVIPVQFKGDTISAKDLEKLNFALNGTSSDTGWESVSSYYSKSSGGLLNLTFDIMDVFALPNAASYYSSYKKTVTTDDGSYDMDGSEYILLEALKYYEDKIDLTKYDTNGDGCIDAVYLIYSENVDYDNADFFWAYVTTSISDDKFDGLYPYYYLFAGFDFMGESVKGSGNSSATAIDGLIINASTYIHETGHLLGLDDYYDADSSKGYGNALGGCTMMDYTVGDLDAYSKIMLGWIDPVIITATGKYALPSFSESGKVYMILLDYNGSYFSEYLLVDFYTSSGINALHAGWDSTTLFPGADYGVRIYHVSTSINNPYSDEYYSFTDYNNSTTNIPLIKLVEADGEKFFTSGDGYAEADDLWQTGGSLRTVFPNYTRNDGKLLCFDITIVSSAADGAEISVTFDAA